MSRKDQSLRRAAQQWKADRDERRRELEAEYDQWVTDQAVDPLLDGPADDPALLARILRKRNGIAESRDAYVKRGLSQWGRERSIVVAGQYRDDDWTIAVYQREFILALVRLSPSVVEELFSFSPLFNSVFGRNPDGLHAAFEWHRFDRLIDCDCDLRSLLDTHLETIVPSSIFDGTGTSRIGNHSLGEFQDDCKWLELRLLLLAAKALSPNSTERDRLQLSRMLSRSMCSFGEEHSRVDGSRSASTDAMGRRLFEIMLAHGSVPDLVTRTKGAISKIFLESVGNSMNVEAFITLKLELLEWAERHGLLKDWILRYSYHFMRQRAENPEVNCPDIPVPTLSAFTHTDKFTFEFEGWIPSREPPQVYEARLVAEVKGRISAFFQFWGRRLNLDRLTEEPGRRVTRRRDVEFESIRWLIAWNECATYQHIAEVFHREKQTIMKGIRSLRSYGLPIRQGVRGRRVSQVSHDRLVEIRSGMV